MFKRGFGMVILGYIRGIFWSYIGIMEARLWKLLEWGLQCLGFRDPGLGFRGLGLAIRV